MSIDLSGLTWEAFATLATGFAAVAGATAVGLRQTKISRRQNEILDRQSRLAEAEIRADLFERRLQTFEATADFVIHISELPDADPKHQERMNLFAAKLRESQFLFNPRVYAALSEIWEMGNDFRGDRAVSIDNRRDGVRNDPELERRILEQPSWLLRRLETLAEVFREDLDLGQFLDPRPDVLRIE
jgi:hypothetical protein